MTAPTTHAAAIPRPADEELRLAALHRCQVLDTPAEEAFDTLVEWAARVCDAPCAQLALVDADRVWTLAAYGMPADARARDEDCSAWTILQQEPLLIADLLADPRTAKLPSVVGPRGLRMYAGASLEAADGQRIGALCVLDTQARMPDPAQVDWLLRLSRLAMALIDRNACRQGLDAALAENARLASIDALTGLLNRRALLERLDVEVERAHRFGTPLSMVMLAVDHFKAINAVGGLAGGDALLRELGGLVRDELRQVDIAGRYGDGELCIVLPGTPLAGGMTLAEALRSEIEQHARAQSDTRLAATASFGLATLDVDAGEDATTLLKTTDDALARAKQEGNRVVCFDPESAGA